MARAHTETTGLSAPDVKVLQNIQKINKHLTEIIASQGEQEPEWEDKTRSPDLVIGDREPARVQPVSPHQPGSFPVAAVPEKGS